MWKGRYDRNDSICGRLTDLTDRPRQENIEKDKEIKEKERPVQRDGQTDTQTEKQTQIQTSRDKNQCKTKTYRLSDTDKHIYGNTDTAGQTDTETDRK